MINEKTESVTHIVSACSIFDKSQYRKPHDKVGPSRTGCCERIITYNAVTSGTHTHTPQSVYIKECKILWDFNNQTDKVTEYMRPDKVCIDKLNRECQIIDFAIPGDKSLSPAIPGLKNKCTESLECQGSCRTGSYRCSLN